MANLSVILIGTIL